MSDSIKILICGDIINQFSQEQFIDDDLIDKIKTSDFSVGNLEGILSFAGSQNKGMMQDASTLKSLKEAGFDLLLLANNHILDYGEKGLSHTLKAIDKMAFSRTGADFGYKQAYKPFIKTIKGKKFGFFNFCEAQNGFYHSKNKSCGYAWMGAPEITLIIKQLREQVDSLIVLPHAGLEHYDLPLPQFRELYQTYCDLGADCVIASHPHITQGIELYNNKIIAYSLGNFFFPRFREADSKDSENSSFSLILKFDEDGIGYEPIFHSMDNLRVHIDKTPKVDFKQLNNNLCPSFYEDKIKEQNKHVFDNKVVQLLSSSLMGTSQKDTLKHKIRFMLNYLFKSNKIYGESERQRMKILRHVMLNETYRFVIENENN